MPKVLVSVPGEEVKIEEYNEGAMQLNDMVGGSPECIQLGDSYILYCNQDSIKLDLPVNPHFAQGIIKGNFVITKTGNGERSGLDDSNIQYVMQTFIRSGIE